MKEQITLVNLTKYNDKNTQAPKTRIGYLLVGKDKIQGSEKFKGLSELSQYVDGHEVFEKIPVEAMFQSGEATIVEKVDSRNLMRKTLVIESVVINGKTYNLV